MREEGYVEALDEKMQAAQIHSPMDAITRDVVQVTIVWLM
jgi:hypothetical protein